ncbi:hypothetical protein QEH59_10665 [Coraliomargarita sp. SDUM461004]|uniref:Uncharacterized protein n=1 Tax=Thalassobacterium sedimentorum TaxID=3041258 RepID=A0ABU1AM07_9BACT|nr:hypothetical protein [Coraliomargarita sp. SDUM461004]MDQ8194890.1 hypothetical protein [Coraliomargarita sp. SDUM461004]
MKAQFITLSAIMASVSWSSAQTDVQSHSNNLHESERAVSQLTINSNEIAEANQRYQNTMNVETPESGQVQQLSDLSINKHDSDNILTDSRGNNYTIDTNGQLRSGVDTGYGRNDRNVAEDLRMSNYKDRDRLSRSIVNEIKRDEELARDWVKHQEQVDSWRNQVRNDLALLNQSSESDYELARDRLHKSYSSYHDAKVQARGFISQPNTRASTPHK